MQKGPALSECNESKGFAPILILVGILVVGIITGGVYYFGKSQVSKPQLPNPVVASQTPQPTTVPQPSSAPGETANWKTFSSNDIAPNTGVTFQYPQDWNVKPMYTFGSTTVVDFQQNETITTVLTFSLVANQNSDTSKPYASLNEYLKISEKDESAKDLLIGKYKARMVTNAGGALATPFEEAVVFTPDRSIIISFFYHGKGAYLNPSLAPTIDQILSTVKFAN